MIGTNLYEFIPQTPLQFQEGDIFGVYADVNNGSGLTLYEQRESGPTNLRISDSLNSPPSTISEILITVGNDFPMVTVEISIYIISLYSLHLLLFFLGIYTQPTVTFTSSIAGNSLEVSISITSVNMLSPSSLFSHELSSNSICV